MKMPNIYIFNPENDLALGFGQENYTPPMLAAKLRRDFQMLPIWYCDKDSLIFAENTVNYLWLRNLANNIEINSKVIDEKTLINSNNLFLPWGWSADMRKRLIDRGVDTLRLPKKQQIADIRLLSHRRTSIDIIKALGDKYKRNMPYEFSNFKEVKAFAENNRNCYIKTPWSSSGQGIFHVLDTETLDFERWTKGVIKRQGSIMCEREYDKVLDFAMEFYASKGKVTFAGYSVFENDSHCSFSHGYIGHEEYLQSLIFNYLDEERKKDILSLKRKLEVALTEIIGNKYTGYLGVDMLLYNDKSTRCVEINPCVELNLRMTMGMVVVRISERYLQKSASGKFVTEFFKDSATLQDKAAYLQKNFPPEYQDGKIIKGVQMLTPQYSDSLYIAYIIVD